MINKPHLTLHLYHGRHSLDEEMDGWGFDGPRIPITYLGFTYGTLWYGDAEGNRCDLKIVDGCVEWEGKYYGDFEIDPTPSDINTTLLTALEGLCLKYGTFRGIHGRPVEYDEPPDSPMGIARAAVKMAKGGGL